MSRVPDELLYSEEHLWVAWTDDDVTIGLTHYGQQELGEMIFVELPGMNEKFARLDVFGTVEARELLVHAWELHEDHLTQLLLAVVSEPDGDIVVGPRDPEMLLGVEELVGNAAHVGVSSGSAARATRRRRVSPGRGGRRRCRLRSRRAHA